MLVGLGGGLRQPTCTTNGYEARSSDFKAGVTELLIEKEKRLLASL